MRRLPASWKLSQTHRGHWAVQANHPRYGTDSGSCNCCISPQLDLLAPDPDSEVSDALRQRVHLPL